MADLVEIQITTFTADAFLSAFLSALVPAGQWVWTSNSQLFTGSLRHSMQRYHYQRYLVNRDDDRHRRNAPPRWVHNSAALMVSLTHAKQRRSTRARGRLVNHLYDWMAHESNLAKGCPLAKGSDECTRASANCPLCGTPATQAHINTVCSHPALLDQRILLKRDIDMHFLCFRHTVLPPAQRWISLLMHYAETHLWEDSERAGDIWNGRWSTHLLRELLIEHSDSHIPPADYSTAMLWLSNLTLILQKTQTALYSTRRHILRQMDLLPANTNVTLRRPRPRPSGPRTQTLFSAWNIPYSRGIHPPKRPPRYQGRCDLAPRRTPLRQTVLGYRSTHPVPPPHCRPATSTSSHRKRAPTRFQRGRNKATQREDHRTTQLKIRRIA